MNIDLMTLLVCMNDLEKSLVYIIKNSAYKQEAAKVAYDHIKEISVALLATRRVLDVVLREQMNIA